MDPEWAPCGTCACVDGDAGFERWELKGRWKSRLCPRRLITEETEQWLQLHAHYRAGHLLVAGGLIDQPAIYLSAMYAIDAYVAEANKEWSLKRNSG